MDLRAQVWERLQFVGYTLEGERGKAQVWAHPERLNLAVIPPAGGFLFSASFKGSQDPLADRLALLDFVNRPNRDAIVTRFCGDKDGDLRREARWPALDNRTAFARFPDGWDRDTRRLLVEQGEEAHRFPA